MKIIELLIDKLEELGGFDTVALVEEPAIEADFFAFNNKEILDTIEYQTIKLAVEEYLAIERDGKPLFDSIEEAERVAKELGCEGSHEHEIDGEIWYMPCKEHADLTDDLLENYEFNSTTVNLKPTIDASGRIKFEDEQLNSDGNKRIGSKGDESTTNRQDVPKSLATGVGEPATSLTTANFIDELPISEQEKIFETLSNRGVHESKLKKEGYEVVEPEEFFKHIFAEVNNFNPGISNKTGLPLKRGAKQTDAITTKGAKVLYEYVGPVDSKIRQFCKRMMQLSNKGLLWSKTDLQNIQGGNPEFPTKYNIYEYKGSYGCRHNWRTVYLYQKQPKKAKVTVSFLQKAELASKGYKFGLDEEQRKVVGAMLIPNKLILRIDENGKGFYVYFSEETVRAIAEKAMREKLIDRINLEHNPDVPVKGYMTQSWIVENPETDRGVAYGMKMPKSTWMAEYKIEDDNVWQMIKDGVVNGFSIEGMFQNKVIQ